MRYSSLVLVVAACLPLAAAPPPRDPKPLASQDPTKGTVQEITVHGASLEGNLDNDPADRPVSVYLPPSYNRDARKRYPVVYFLHGYTDTNGKWFGADPKWINLRDILDRAIASGAGKEMIAVVPNAYTRFQGSMYSNSIVTGNWEDFITSDLVRYIDSHYRTLTARESRGIAGHSMGGYGAIKLAMKHPEVFSTVYVMSACCLIWGADFQPTGAVGLKIFSIHTDDAIDRTDFGIRATFAEAAAWSPNPDNPPFYVDLPLSRDQQARPEIVAKWSANMPLGMIDQYWKNLQRLRAVALDVGDQDDFAHIPLGMASLDRALTEYKIPHTYEVYQGTHTSQIPQRLESKVVPFFAKSLVFAPAEKAAAK